mgnify:CR=1 FL=1|tara:strand:- start:1938 stop:2246 length:309 start_codon:yes stop_codon:yes gene_type:complete
MELVADAPHQKHSETSVKSAQRVDFPRNQRLVLDAMIIFPGGLTDEQGCWKTGMTGDSYRPARIALSKLGLIQETGDKRPTKAKRMAAVHTLSMLGKLEAGR